MHLYINLIDIHSCLLKTGILDLNAVTQSIIEHNLGKVLLHATNHLSNLTTDNLYKTESTETNTQ